QRGDRMDADREDSLDELLDLGVDRIVGPSALRLREGVIADRAEGAIDEDIDALGCGVGRVHRLAGPAALELARREFMRDGGVAVLRELGEAGGQGPDLPERKETAAGGEVIEVEDGLERAVHGFLLPGIGRSLYGIFSSAGQKFGQEGHSR